MAMVMCRWVYGYMDTKLREHVKNYNLRNGLGVENPTERCRKTRLWLFGLARRDENKAMIEDTPWM